MSQIISFILLSSKKLNVVAQILYNLNIYWHSRNLCCSPIQTFKGCSVSSWPNIKGITMAFIFYCNIKCGLSLLQYTFESYDAALLCSPARLFIIGPYEAKNKTNDIYHYPIYLCLLIILYVLRTDNAQENSGLVNNKGQIPQFKASNGDSISCNLKCMDWKIFL